jgi:hypothetical protein
MINKKLCEDLCKSQFYIGKRDYIKDSVWNKEVILNLTRYLTMYKKHLKIIDYGEWNAAKERCFICKIKYDSKLDF